MWKALNVAGINLKSEAFLLHPQAARKSNYPDLSFPECLGPLKSIHFNGQFGSFINVCCAGPELGPEDPCEIK